MGDMGQARISNSVNNIARMLSSLALDDDMDINLFNSLQTAMHGQHFGGERRSCTVFASSFSMGYMASETTFVRQWSTQTNVRFSYNYNTRLVTIYFGHAGHTYKVEFKLNTLNNNGEIVVEDIDTSGNQAALTMMLKHPGRFWLEWSRNGRKESAWYRVVDLDSGVSSHVALIGTGYNGPPSSPLPSSSTAATANPLGKWTAYRVTFTLHMSTHTKARTCYKTLIRKLVEHKAIPRGPITPGVKIGVEHDPLSTHPSLSSSAPSSQSRVGHDERYNRIKNFEAFYTLESFISSYRLNENALTEDFYTILCRLPPFVAIDALKLMCYREDERVWHPLEKLQELVQKQSTLGLGHLRGRRRRRSHITYVYKVMVTPTTFVLELPQPEMSNRVVRHFRRYDDRFLRVTFVEEGLGTLMNTASTRHLISEKLFDRILKIIRDGIRIGDRYYEFLAFSSSQLRTHGCWFFSSTTMEEDGSLLDANRIRQWMGNFRNERVVAKHAARMGQVKKKTGF
ncbi:RNA dependent RNA polymerase-domain-containing protein [Zychaea mexicana]|uniref:RNA dependent RNA polymerase-domain-containing protein n=1 Tax=Zychaea mexicana TaxID=64656 RepID=UPI0022FEFB37|nr:RNA dependent RNA polymerase-domain-containing protein [Zychaea mexicana]KAI9488696.1 RNA dependent RNA polymerase-domain-containing protein [Zychaea mexicana]